MVETTSSSQSDFSIPLHLIPSGQRLCSWDASAGVSWAVWTGCSRAASTGKALPGGGWRVHRRLPGAPPPPGRDPNTQSPGLWRRGRGLHAVAAAGPEWRRHKDSVCGARSQSGESFQPTNSQEVIGCQRCT